MASNKKTSNSRKGGLKKRLFLTLGLGIPLLSFLGSGFFTLDEMEVAVVVEYKPSELFTSNSDPWTHFIALKEGQLPGGAMKIVGVGSRDPLVSIGGKDIYWHVPAPFGKSLKIDIQQDFQAESSLVIPQYLYDRDEDGNIIGIIRDDLDEAVVFGYYFVTKDGVKFYSPETLSRERYDPDFSLDVLKVVVTGEFKVTDVEMYASNVTAYHANKIEWMEELGFYGEMTSPPSINDQLEFFLGLVLNDYILEFKIPFVISAFAEEYPDRSDDFVVKTALEYLIKNPKTLIDRIPTSNGTIPDFEAFLTSEVFIEETGVDIEQLFGINIYETMEVRLFEEPL